MRICTRTAYASQAIARSKIAQIERNRLKSLQPRSQKSYAEKLCETCGMWHLTSRNGRG